MGMNYDLWSPLIQPDLAYDVTLKPSLRGIDVLGDGTLVVQDVAGNVAAYPFSGVTNFVRLGLQIEKIIGDGSGGVGDGTAGTDISIVNLRGLR